MPITDVADQVNQAIAEYNLSKYPHAHIVSDERNREWIKYCVPREEDAVSGVPFVAAETMNIVIFQAPNDFYESDGIIDHPHSQRIVNTFQVFPRYRTLTFLEIGGAAEKDAENGNTDLSEALIAFESKLIDICEALKDYNFRYIGQIDKRNGVGQDIIDQINAFLNPRNL